MKRLLTIAVLLAAAAAFAATGLADPGDGGSGKKQGKNRFAFTLTVPDNGSCGEAAGPWATDVIRRTYSVKDNGDGTFTLRRTDRGTFTTIGGKSPGACDTTGKHGQTVRAGIKGKFVGYLLGTVKATAFNKNATCVAACFTDTFLATFFTGAQFSCFTDSADCKFNFNYTAKAKQQNIPKLKYRHWQNKGKGAGSMLKEEFIGDIANT
jgi:hypothetical protein